VAIAPDERLRRAQVEGVGEAEAGHGEVADGGGGRDALEDRRLRRLRDEHRHLGEADGAAKPRRLNQRLREVGLHLPGHLRREALALRLLAQREVAHPGGEPFAEHDEGARIKATTIDRGGGPRGCGGGPRRGGRGALRSAAGGLGRGGRGLAGRRGGTPARGGLEVRVGPRVRAGRRSRTVRVARGERAAQHVYDAPLGAVADAEEIPCGLVEFGFGGARDVFEARGGAARREGPGQLPEAEQRARPREAEHGFEHLPRRPAPLPRPFV
jgi:hypothetical protein